MSSSFAGKTKKVSPLFIARSIPLTLFRKISPTERFTIGEHGFTSNSSISKGLFSSRRIKFKSFDTFGFSKVMAMSFPVSISGRNISSAPACFSFFILLWLDIRLTILTSGFKFFAVITMNRFSASEGIVRTILLASFIFACFRHSSSFASQSIKGIWGYFLANSFTLFVLRSIPTTGSPRFSRFSNRERPRRPSPITITWSWTFFSIFCSLLKRIISPSSPLTARSTILEVI